MPTIQAEHVLRGDDGQPILVEAALLEAENESGVDVALAFELPAALTARMTERAEEILDGYGKIQGEEVPDEIRELFLESAATAKASPLPPLFLSFN